MTAGLFVLAAAGITPIDVNNVPTTSSATPISFSDPIGVRMPRTFTTTSPWLSA